MTIFVLVHHVHALCLFLSVQVLSIIPIFSSPFLGISLVFMLLYLWSREFPTAKINLYGLVTLKVFYLSSPMLSYWSCTYNNLALMTGILLAMGDALLRRHIWFSTCAWSFGHCSWASLLLLNSTASACWREEHPKDACIYVSFCVAFRCDISLLFLGNLPFAGRYSWNMRV